ncbi:hypothetical protein SteCoe_31318 [Stentor coeruleus]|uniref:Uncharacterized protein n=1 Tax=Stentor coeruleus TaxID=5963 RepID=A0A1R2B1K4_9CILI|nr:hypothetical protein SteCoe_31318 [Stentor coeruleus]
MQNEKDLNNNTKLPNLSFYDLKIDEKNSELSLKLKNKTTSKTNKRQHIKQRNSLHCNTTIKSSRSFSAHNQNTILSQTEILKEELIITWQNFKIPQQHQKFFTQSIKLLPKLQAASKIAQEIYNIENSNSNIISIIFSITKRESLLQTIHKKFQEQITKPEIFTHIKTLQNLRDITLQVIEFIEIWKSEFLISEDYEWENTSYYEKLKTDSDFLCETNLGKFFNFFLSDPLLTGPVEPKFMKQHSFSIPFTYRQGARIRRAFKILNFIPIKLIKTQISTYISEIPLSTTVNIHTEISQVFFIESTVTEEDIRKEFLEAIKEIVEKVLNDELNRKLEILVRESYKEIITASLALYSSSILDRIITEVLGEIIPVISKDSYNEVTDSEYIDIRNLIINEVMEEQMKSISNIQTNDILSVYVTEEVIGYLELFHLTLETIQEEIEENQSIVYIVVDEVIEEFLLEDWVEDLAEVELVQEKMENVWKDLPGHIQKEIYHYRKGDIMNRICEMIYFNILNDFVGKIWIEGLVQSFIKEERDESPLQDEDIFLLKDPNYQLEDLRKGSILRIIRKN